MRAKNKAAATEPFIKLYPLENGPNLEQVHYVLVIGTLVLPQSPQVDIFEDMY